MDYIIAIGIIAIIIIVYVLTYAINEKTKAPEGCEELTASEACSTCSVGGCAVKTKETVTPKDVK